MPAAYKRCVRKVAASKGTKSAHAICTAANAGNIKQYRKHEAKGSRDKYRSGVVKG